MVMWRLDDLLNLENAEILDKFSMVFPSCPHILTYVFRWTSKAICPARHSLNSALVLLALRLASLPLGWSCHWDLHLRFCWFHRVAISVVCYEGHLSIPLVSPNMGYHGVIFWSILQTSIL